MGGDEVKLAWVNGCGLPSTGEGAVLPAPEGAREVWYLEDRSVERCRRCEWRSCRSRAFDAAVNAQMLKLEI